MTNVIREKWTQTGQLKSKVIQPTEEINVPPGLLLDKQFIDSLRDLKALMVSEKIPYINIKLMLLIIIKE